MGYEAKDGDKLVPIARSVYLQTTNSTMREYARRVEDGQMILDPPYQRSSVWGETRQRNLIRSLVMGLPIGAIFVSDRAYPLPFAVVDGRQRLEAFIRFTDAELTVPRWWFPDEWVSDAAQASESVTYDDLSRPGQRFFDFSATVAVHTARNHGPDFLEREAELFDLVNYGGVPQGESDV